ncbi:hypothetical protein LR48_Vigan05g009900 [Vigna angularis]|uniref:Uncharacterized protein n=1 Tax=Phaseolus angularis TaxID=3914 RepID=A0A0L9UHZ0_PHAAN|nr:hypothetical protein LR48_Vigan05g009900 [Vigna angularis]
MPSEIEAPLFGSILFFFNFGSARGVNMKNGGASGECASQNSDEWLHLCTHNAASARSASPATPLRRSHCRPLCHFPFSLFSLRKNGVFAPN